MSTYKKLRQQNTNAYENVQKSFGEVKEIVTETKTVGEKVKNISVFLQDVDRQFEKATQLSAKDKEFLFVAVALQCIRQYVIGTLTQRKGHNESDRLAHQIQQKIWHAENEGTKKYRDILNDARSGGARYRATTEEITQSYSVPYDVTNGSKMYGVAGLNANGEKIGLSGKNHRYKTLGHDPLLGWVFGTANIMTNTLTNHMCMTYHVKNSKIISHGGFDKTITMLEHVKKRSGENPKDLGFCLIKQGLHIMSDTYSKEGIILPGTVMLNSDCAGRISSYGLDLGNAIKVGVQAGFATLINQIVAMVHGLLYDESIDMSWRLYSVKTQKILAYSNSIASMSNVIAVACGAIAGGATGNGALVSQSLNYLDIGGLIVTIRQIVNNKEFQYQVKKEFLEHEWYNWIMNT